MAAMMGGTMRSPLTAVAFAAEVTHDFNLLPALLMGSVMAFGVTVLSMRRSILTEKLARRGHHVTCEYSIDPFDLIRVRDVMDRVAPTVPASMKLSELAQWMANKDPRLRNHQATMIVDDENFLAGIITRGDVVRSLQTDPSSELNVLEAGSTDMTVAYPDESLHSALDKMLRRDVGRLPIVEPGKRTKIIGYLGRAAILSARIKIHQEENLRHRGWRKKPPRESLLTEESNHGSLSDGARLC